jgi:hypothetical protein
MRAAIVAAICLALIGGPLWAKLPAPPSPTDEQKAAAAAKAAEAAKKEAELLGKYQDLTVEKYKKAHAPKAAAAAVPAPTAAAAKK